MNRTGFDVFKKILAISVLAIGTPAMADNTTKAAKKPATAKAMADANKMLGTWPPGPQLAGQEMMAKYGAPQEVTSERMIWRDAGPYKRIMLTKAMLPHDFPMPHMDYLEHTINFNVPNDKTDEVHAFDASISIYRVAGELSARCDLESNNVLTLNLANDVISGKKSVVAARKQFGEVVVQRAEGKNPPYAMALQFQPQQATAAADLEAVSLPGIPKRSDTAVTGANRDGEILGMLIALDLGEVHAASIAEMKQVGGPVMDYAKMLHEHHGKHVGETAMVGQNNKVTALQTPAVRAFQDKHAGALAKIVPLDGEPFARAYLDLMVKGHTEALQMIDQQLKTAQHEAVKAHLSATRQEIATHLDEAKQLQSDSRSTRTSSRQTRR